MALGLVFDHRQPQAAIPMVSPGGLSSESALPVDVSVGSLKCQHCFRCARLQSLQGCFSRDGYQYSK